MAKLGGTNHAPTTRAEGEPQELSDLHAFCMFIGYPKSGHSLVGSLLDAHPDMVIAKATNPLALLVIDGIPRGYELS